MKPDRDRSFCGRRDASLFVIVIVVECGLERCQPASPERRCTGFVAIRHAFAGPW
jgi:hypothetical protein